MKPNELSGHYFIFGFPLAESAWDRFRVTDLLPPPAAVESSDLSYEIRKLADAVNRDPARIAAGAEPNPAETLLALRTLNQALRWVTLLYFLRENPGGLGRCRAWAQQHLGPDSVDTLFTVFVDLFPPLEVKRARRAAGEFLAAGHRGLGGIDGPLDGFDLATLEMVLLFINVINPAARPLVHLFDDDDLRRRASYLPFVTGLEEYLEAHEPAGSMGVSLFHLLRAPQLASPDSLAGQIAYIRDHWSHLLPEDLVRRLQVALDLLREVDAYRTAQYGPPPILEFGPGRAGWLDGYPEPEAFSRDADWMSNVVLMAKSVYVWLDQLSRWHHRPIHLLSEIPDQELERLARWGVNGLWLIGLWERSSASRRIKQWMGNPEAAASAYSLNEYRIADDLGGEEAWRDLRDRAWRHGIRLASDMVPNHMGIDSRWVIEHPEYFLQLDHPPYPAYRFSGGNLSERPGVTIRIEDGYWDHRDAAVVFQRVDEHGGRARYIYHGNDGTSMPWNDTAQLDFTLPQVREAVIQVILDVARRFPIIRFDAAMTLAKKHYQRLWFPAPGDAGAIPSRAEHGMTRADFDRIFPLEFWREVVDRVAVEAPDTLLLAEAFWLMEGYFVRTLGMHRVYNSAFMNMLKMEDNQKYRQTIKNVLEYSPQILKRFVNFMNNPDERTAVEQFGRGDKYFGCMVLLVTMPGLPMLGHGQVEGFTEKYGMEYRKAYWDEQVDQDMVRRHEHQIFPLMRRRSLFSGAEDFALFDFVHDHGWVDENVFAYSNRRDQERALILYNNAYESTAGRIRVSAAVNRGLADQPDLVQLGLAEALDLDGAADVWYVLADQADGLQYLRSGAELCRYGLHTQLRGYQFRAFLGFERLVDTDGRWAELATALGGAGVPDLQNARLRRGLEPALARVRAWMSPELLGWLEAAPAGGEKNGDPAEAPPALDDLPPAMAEPAPGLAELPSALAELPSALAELAERLRRLPAMTIPSRLGARSRQDLAEIIAALPHSRALQAVYLAAVLRAAEESSMGLPAGAGDLVAEDMRTAVQQWLGHDHPARMTALAATVLAAVPQGPAAMAAGRIDWMTEVLDLPAGRSLLGVNEHAGTVWFHAEALDDWLLTAAAAALAQENPPDPVSLLDALALVRQAAVKAEYKVKDFLALIA